MTPTCVTTTSATTTRSLLPTRPETGRGRPPTTHQSHQSKERRLTPSASRRIGTGEHRQALTGGPYLSIEVGHTGLSKASDRLLQDSRPPARRKTPGPTFRLTSTTAC